MTSEREGTTHSDVASDAPPPPSLLDPSPSAASEETPTHDVLIVGGGVVGLSVLRSATLAGYDCALIEAERHLLSGASGSNSGIACTGVDAPPGSLERALIRDSIGRLRRFCGDFNVPTRDCGSLICLWPWDGDDIRRATEAAALAGDGKAAVNVRLREVASESWNAGDSDASILSADEVRRIEPGLSAECLGAVRVPGEIVLDPFLFPVALASHARENGARIYTNFELDPSRSSFDGPSKVWTVFRRGGRNGDDDDDGNPSDLRARVVVNAAGVHSDVVQSKTPSAPDPSWTARPRRGQYRMFSSSAAADGSTGRRAAEASSSVRLTRPIQPIPTPRTKGIFVFSTLYDQIVVGPTALDQTSRTDRAPDPRVANDLARHVRRVLPSLDVESSCVGEYVGIRPGTDRQDYQIEARPNERWVTATGMRSTGLTASLGIGRHVVGLVRSVLPRPFSSRKEAAKEKRTALPDVAELVDEFHRRGDGMVTVNGFLYGVTHPITRLGWEARTGIASAKPPRPLPAAKADGSYGMPSGRPKL